MLELIVVCLSIVHIIFCLRGGKTDGVFMKKQMHSYKHLDKFPDLYMRYYRKIGRTQYSHNVTNKQWTYKSPNTFAPTGPFASFTEAYEHSTLLGA